MSKLWRCYNCPDESGVNWHEWQGVPKCSKCGLSQKDKVGGERIVERVAIHFDPPHPVVKGRGSGLRSCDSKPANTGQVTGSAVAVTCPECLKTKAFASAAEEQGTLIATDPEADFVIEKPEVASGS